MGLFASYEIEDIIASDNVSTLYRCSRSTDNLPLAIEVLAQQLVDSHPEIITRFSQQNLPQLRLNHRYIARISDSGVASGLPYFVYSYPHGKNLDKIIAEASLSSDQRMDVILQLCKVLVYAHTNNILHLRLTPANIVLTPDNQVMVRGFGLAQFLMQAVDDKEAIRAKLMLGSIAYTPPEVKTSAELTPAADLYSLGILMFSLVTGGHPVDMAQTPITINPSCPVFLDALIMQCLQQSPAARPKGAGRIQMQLLDGLQDTHIQPAKKQLAMAGIDPEFILLDILKETSQSAVYLFRNTVNQRLMVVKKIFKPEKDLGQCQALGGLRHPNIVDIYGTSEVDGDFLLKMAYMEAGSLQDRMVTTWIWRDALKIIRDICIGLAFAHKAGVIHGNLRPTNVFLGDTGEVRIADFCLDEHYRDGAGASNWYRLANESDSQQTDIFSTGVILFEMITGRIYDWPKGEWAVDQRYLALPSAVQRLISRMLEIVPKDRYQSCEQLIAAIDGIFANKTTASRARDSSPMRQKPGRLIAWLLLLLLLLLLGGYILTR